MRMNSNTYECISNVLKKAVPKLKSVTIDRDNRCWNAELKQQQNEISKLYQNKVKHLVKIVWINARLSLKTTKNVQKG